jgi:hypothetical protein
MAILGWLNVARANQNDQRQVPPGHRVTATVIGGGGEVSEIWES